MKAKSMLATLDNFGLSAWEVCRMRGARCGDVSALAKVARVTVVEPRAFLRPALWRGSNRCSAR